MRELKNLERIFGAEPTKQTRAKVVRRVAATRYLLSDKTGRQSFGDVDPGSAVLAPGTAVLVERGRIVAMVSENQLKRFEV